MTMLFMNFKYAIHFGLLDAAVTLSSLLPYPRGWPAAASAARRPSYLLIVRVHAVTLAEAHQFVDDGDHKAFQEVTRRFLTRPLGWVVSPRPHTVE